ncbi:hypothetical protein [Paracidovorax anthurii]|uniref:hypothetical protein n=1 Tax=Paracidovorax anthurii TaxID=78229 RepID=UPI0011BE617F|nr:hypothetical protein [Paracidovorax anthurii]
MAKVLQSEIANSYFLEQGVKLGPWNCLETPKSEGSYVASSFCTGKSTYELIAFSQHIAGWLTKGRWKIIQIDNSSHFYPDQESVLGALLLGPAQPIDLANNRTYLFEFGANERMNFQEEVVLAYVINLMLIYEAHCYVISSGGEMGEMIAIQDGVVYFYGNRVRLSQAKDLLTELQTDPLRPAAWTQLSEST